MLRDKRKKLLKRNTISDFYRSREQNHPGQFDGVLKIFGIAILSYTDISKLLSLQTIKTYFLE